jgi:hypothetical protein
VLEVLDDCTGNGRFHQLARARELRCRQVGAVPQQVADPLVLDALGPSGPDDTGPRQPNEQVTERCGIQNVGIVERDDRSGARHP